MSSRTLIVEPPFAPSPAGDRRAWQEQGGWPFCWVRPSFETATPAVVLYRCRFLLEAPDVVRIHVSADERYELYLDGAFVGRGPERCDPDHWCFETYDLPMTAAPHTLVARVWSLGELAPWAQRSVRHGLLLAPQAPDMGVRCGTGVGRWEAKRCEGISFVNPSERAGAVLGVGAAEVLGAREFPWGFETGEGDGWAPVVAGERGNDGFTLMSNRAAHRLTPASLPAMLDQPVRHLRVSGGHGADRAAWERLLAARQPVSIPPRAQVRVVIEVVPYSCFYPEIEFSGGGDGARLQMVYGETDPGDAPLRGLADVVLLDGSSNRTYRPLWWRCGRFVEISVQTSGEVVTIHRFTLRETRYPLEMATPPQIDPPGLMAVMSMCRRTAELCCHETFMDCPYYEQLMYVGDTRVQCLLNYVSTSDARPVVKALRIFDASRLNFNQMPTDAAPGDSKFIPPFALLWVAMVHDFAMYKRDVNVLRSVMRGVRGTLERFLADVDVATGLLRSPQGWNFIDWAGEPFRDGVPPGGEAGGFNACVNLQFYQALVHAAALEAYLGEQEMHARWLRLAGQLRTRVHQAFFDPSASLFRECVDGGPLTEQAQCLALLSGIVTGTTAAAVVQQLVSRRDLVRCSSYFTHYLLEVLGRHRQSGAFFHRLEPWLALAGQGIQTTPETFGKTRSHCHAWSAHPLFHLNSTIAGIRPSAFGYESIRIRPMLGSLRLLQVETPVPDGKVTARFQRDAHEISVRIDIDSGLRGSFRNGRFARPLKPGVNEFRIPADSPV